jgi:hypothetical protein
MWAECWATYPLCSINSALHSTSFQILLLRALPSATVSCVMRTESNSVCMYFLTIFGPSKSKERERERQTKKCQRYRCESGLRIRSAPLTLLCTPPPPKPCCLVHCTMMRSLALCVLNLTVFLTIFKSKERKCRKISIERAERRESRE